MATQAITPSPVPLAECAPSIEELLRQLVSHIVASGGALAPHHHDDRVETILLDVDVDGARYLLVRLPKNDRQPVQLSPREHEIVRMVAQGHSNKMIADVLAISSWTVCTHLRRIFAKLGVGSRAAMVARLLESGGGAVHKAAAPKAADARPLRTRLTGASVLHQARPGTRP